MIILGLVFYKKKRLIFELPSHKDVGFVSHRNELNGLLESYSFSKRLTSCSSYGSMMINYWLSNLS
ncbi:MAG: hypothetical protein KGD63_07710 [Candidatus Lokiarchaeota archaeon]|nr:hypothetical protein [Candidatus Lokiarchaeota archaeon]